MGDKRGRGPIEVLGAFLLLFLGFIVLFSLLKGREDRELDVKELINERDRLLDELRLLLAMRTEGTISDEEFERRRQRLAVRIKKLDEKISKLEARGAAS